MSPPTVRSAAPVEIFEDDLNLSIVGLGVQYPDFHNGPEALETLAKRHYPESNVMTKVLSINRFTGIQKRAAIGDAEHPVVNKPEPPTIRELNDLFMNDGVRMSVGASRKALAEWGGSAKDITHMVSTTCTNSANPGYDHFVAKELGLSASTQKLLLHGIGCSGGLAAIRTAANLALGATARRRPARVLVLACEVSSVFVRSELESINQNQEVRIGVCLFSDCASACIVSNGIGELEGEELVNESARKETVFDILGWQHQLIDDTAQDLGFDVDPLGWKVVLTPRVPSLTSAATPPAFQSLLCSIPTLHSSGATPEPTDFAWALHPGGSTILTSVQAAMGLTEDNLLASYQVYVEHGNSSSATIMSVMDKLRRNAAEQADASSDGKVLGGKGVVAAAFGPGISLEMMMLRRGKTHAPNGTLAISNGHINNVAHTNGAATNGAPTNGVATNGVATNGVATNGVATNGVATNGVPTNGVATNGHATNGVALTHLNGTNGGSVRNGNGHTGPVSFEEGMARLEVEDVD